MSAVSCVSHIAQGPIGRIYMELKEDYRCFLDSEVTFKLHNLRVLVQACNYFLFFLSGGILDKSPFCLEELLSAIHSNRCIFLVRDLQFQLPSDIKAIVADVMQFNSALGPGHIKEHYGWSVDEAAARIEAAIKEAWPSRITYHAEHFGPCMKRIRERLGLPVLSSKLAEMVAQDKDGRALLQPTPHQHVDFVGFHGLEELDLSGKVKKDNTTLLQVIGVLQASSCSLTSLKYAAQINLN